MALTERTSNSRRSRSDAGSSAALRAQRPRIASSIGSVAWVPAQDIEYPEWISAGRRLGAIARCSKWWLGDWIRYGSNRWGEKYAEAARVTGYDVQSLRNIAWVASCFSDPSRRREELSWSHHETLAALEPDEQERWLDRAVAERLSVADLRVELRDHRRGVKRALAGQQDAQEEPHGRGFLTCPSCGNKVPVE